MDFRSVQHSPLWCWFLSERQTMFWWQWPMNQLESMLHLESVLHSWWLIAASWYGLEIVRTEFSLCRQHLDGDWVCFGKLQDPTVAEEVAAAHSSTQQPVSRQKVNWIHNERREAYYNPGSNSLSEGIRFGGEVKRRGRRPGNDWMNKRLNAKQK